jgi:hypothetical protein
VHERYEFGRVLHWLCQRLYLKHRSTQKVATIFELAEIAPGNFRGHYFVGRGQKARFLSAASAEGA